jgi:hypothetical protein
MEVRVVSVDRQESVVDDPHFDGTQPPIRLGVMRLRDMNDFQDDHEEKISAWRRVRTALVPLVPLNGSIKSYCTAFAGLVAAVVLIIWMVEHLLPDVEAVRIAAPTDPAPALSEKLAELPQQQVIKLRHADKVKSKWVDGLLPTKDLARGVAHEAKGAADGAPGEFKTSGSDPASALGNWLNSGSSSASRDASVTSAASDSADANETDIATLGDKNVPEAVARRAAPHVLLQPEVSDLLSLTRYQREQLRRIAQAHAAGESGKSAAQVLTTEQRRLLLELPATSALPDPGSK